MGSKCALLVTFVSLIIPLPASALCTSDDFTIVYVNGILTDEQQATEDASHFWKVLGTSFRGERLKVQTGYNASHLAGYGDFLQSISQGLGFSLNDFDLITILNQIAPEVTTQKILLVGHSQGTFYTNEMYEYLTEHGVSADSIAVYNLATPASFVAGGGKYLTSTNDKVINKVRDTDEEFHTALALPGNVTYPKEPGYESNDWGGHSLSDVYIANGAHRIVSDIQSVLAELRSDSASANTQCFVAPSEGVAYKVQSAVLAVADPVAQPVNTYIVQPKVQQAVTFMHASQYGIAALSTFNAKANTALNTAISNAFFSVFPRPDAQSASVAFAVEKQLYGSSLSVDEYKALLDGENPYETPEQPAAPRSSTPAPEQDVFVPEAPVDAAFDPTSSAGTTLAPAPAQPIAGPQVSASVIAGYGGGSAPSVESHAVAPDSSASDVPDLIPLYVSSPSNFDTFGTTTVVLSGTTTPGHMIQVAEGADSASITADTNGAWSIAHVFTEGSHSISVSTASGSAATSTTRIFSVDLAAASTPVAVIKECQHASVPCLVTNTNLTLLWDATDHSSYYEVLKNGAVFATTTATTTFITANSASSTSFTVVAHSYSGQTATSSEVSVVVGTESDRGGNISTSETWSPSGNPYVINSQVTVPAGVTLTIEPGTVVKVGSASPSAIEVSGTLVVGANGNDPVIITSVKDDSVLGDTNGDGSASNPATGDWSRIDVLTGSSATIRNAQLRYGGARVFNATGFYESATIRNNGGSALLDHVQISDAVDAFVHGGNASSTIQNSTFGSASEYGVWAYGGGSVSILSSSLSAGVPVYASGSELRIGADTFTPVSGVYAVQISNGSFENDGANSGSGVIAIGALPDNSNTVLPADGLPYSITSATPNVPAHASLTIKSGASLKSNGSVIDIAGILNAGEIGGKPVVFTSYHDDGVLGHLSGIAASSPQAKDWQGITVESGSSAAFANVEIRYAGDCVTHDSLRDCATLRNLGGTLTLDHVTIANGFDTGIGQSGGTGNATHVSFAGLSSATGISVTGGAFSIHKSSFAGLGSGMSANVAVDATENWWGDSSGARNPGTNPSATGTYASDSVAYDPWLVCDSSTDASCTTTNHSNEVASSTAST